MTIDGAVEHPLHLSFADLSAQPAAEIDATFLTGQGQQTGHFRGALLWPLIERSKIAAETGAKRSELRHYLLVTGQDGYAVALSIGEIEPDFEGKPVILAYERDGKALDGIRLIVPGDKHGGRAVRAVVHIDVK